MKALILNGYGTIRDNLTFSEMEKPKIGKNQVLIEVHAASTNPIDCKIILGEFKQYVKLKLPSPLGYDVSGIVVGVGEEVDQFNIGDEVYSVPNSATPGAFAEFIAVDSNLISLKPNNVSFCEAAGLPLVGLTAIQALQYAEIKSGDKILIHAGSGGVGTFAIQYAKKMGAFVYTTTSTKNVEWVTKLGADRVIDYTKENYLEILQDLDVVIDALGGKYTTESFDIIRTGGKVISLSGAVDARTAKELGLNVIIRSVLGLVRRKITKKMKAKSASYRLVIMKPESEQLNEIKRLVEDETIKPIIDREYDFNEIVDAIEYQQTGRAKGKVVIKLK